jgi:hypothetical protein
MWTWLQVSLSLLVFGIYTHALNPIVRRGNLLYDSVTQERFFIKGVTYDAIPDCLGYDNDPYADDFYHEYLDLEKDLRDIVKLNANTIRIYQVSPFKTHAKFMALAESVGLYVIVPLTGTSWGYLDSSLPSPACYTSTINGYGHVGANLLYNAKAIANEFSQHQNVLMFAVGNELILYAEDAGKNSFPCLKAMLRDLHHWQVRQTTVEVAYKH